MLYVYLNLLVAYVYIDGPNNVAIERRQLSTCVGSTWSLGAMIAEGFGGVVMLGIRAVEYWFERAADRCRVGSKM